jgi:hypothetical protein
MLRRAARRVNPLWAYQEEKARKSHPGSLQDEQWGWVYAPTSAALYSVAWQLALVAGVLGSTALMTSPQPDSVWRDLLFGASSPRSGCCSAGRSLRSRCWRKRCAAVGGGCSCSTSRAWWSCFERSTTRLDPVGRFIHTRGSSRAS